MKKFYSKGGYLVYELDSLIVERVPIEQSYFSIIDSNYNITSKINNKSLLIRSSWVTSNELYKEDGLTLWTLYSLEDFLYRSSTSSDSSVSNYNYEVASGKIEGASVVNKFGVNRDVDTTTDPEIIASFGGQFDPTTDVITTAQTFTIAYNNTTDGLGTTGALSLLFSYIDSSFLPQTGLHTLGSTGSDVTSFSGVGINRVVVLSSGSLGYNANDITITATIDATTQAQLPALSSVTQQAIYHTPISTNLFLDWLFVAAGKTSGGAQPNITISGYSWSRVTETRYLIFEAVFNTQRQNFLELTPSQPFPVGGREVIWFEVETDTNDTKVELRFSGNQQPA